MQPLGQYFIIIKKINYISKKEKQTTSWKNIVHLKKLVEKMGFLVTGYY
jgi:hypothetical protein